MESVSINHCRYAIVTGFSENLRYIVNPQMTVPFTSILSIRQGEIDWDTLFSKLREMKFDGIATIAVFAWFNRADK